LLVEARSSFPVRPRIPFRSYLLLFCPFCPFCPRGRAMASSFQSCGSSPEPHPRTHPLLPLPQLPPLPLPLQIARAACPAGDTWHPRPSQPPGPAISRITDPREVRLDPPPLSLSHLPPPPPSLSLSPSLSWFPLSLSLSPSLPLPCSLRLSLAEEREDESASNSRRHVETAPYATMPLCHYATMPLCHYATMPLCMHTRAQKLPRSSVPPQDPFCGKRTSLG